MTWLSGKKTIIGTIVLAALGVALSLGYIDEPLFGILASLVGLFTGVSAVAHINKLPAQTVADLPPGVFVEGAAPEDVVE